MNDDIERRLRRVTPRGAPPELRARVLDAVAAELRSAEPASSGRGRPLRLAIAIAAGVLASLWLNVWVNDRLDHRLAAVLGPPPVRKQAAELAADVSSITDRATGRWVYQRLVASRPDPDNARRYAIRLRQMIQQLTANLEETAHESPQKNPQMDRDHHGSRDRHRADLQCFLRLEHRNTA
jgi:hypothetical protein